MTKDDGSLSRSTALSRQDKGCVLTAVYRGFEEVYLAARAALGEKDDNGQDPLVVLIQRVHEAEIARIMGTTTAGTSHESALQ